MCRMSRRSACVASCLLAAYMVVVAGLSAWLCFQARTNTGPLSPYLFGLTYLIYALSWGCVGGCVSTAMAAAKHVADQDFDPAWMWWYYAKPLLGAVMGVVTYVLVKGLGVVLGSGVSVTNGFGVAALAFVAGFAAERTVLKVDEVGKTLFSVDAKAMGMSILAPLQGQSVTGPSRLRVVVSVPGKPAYLTASCLEEQCAGVSLVHQEGGIYTGELDLSDAPGPKTICVTAVIADQTLTEQVTVNSTSAAKGAA